MKINLEVLKDPKVKKAVSIATAVLAGVAAVTSSFADQRKEQEFEDMKKAISELQNK